MRVCATIAATGARCHPRGAGKEASSPRGVATATTTTQRTTWVAFVGMDFPNFHPIACNGWLWVVEDKWLHCWAALCIPAERSLGSHFKFFPHRQSGDVMLNVSRIFNIRSACIISSKRGTNQFDNAKQLNKFLIFLTHQTHQTTHQTTIKLTHQKRMVENKRTAGIS